MIMPADPFASDPSCIFTPEERELTKDMPINVAMGAVMARRKKIIEDMVKTAQVPEHELREAFETLAERMGNGRPEA